MCFASRLLALVLLATTATAARAAPPRCIHRHPNAQRATGANLDWRARLAGGSAVTVVLTFSDSRDFEPATDPFGTLLGGTSYTLRYFDGAFALTGFSESTKGVGTWTYRNAALADNTISLWGVVARVESTTGALISDGRTLGYLR